MNRQTLSVVIMTKDYEDMVEGTLKSVAGWADEIVVLDGFSTDSTVEICRRYTPNVYQNKWDRQRYSSERNLATSKATMDWCLHIDPDERATPEFRNAVTKILTDGTPHAAFEFHKKNHLLGHWMRFGGWYHYSRHFFRRTKGHYEGVVHESLIVDGTIGKIEAPVDHYPIRSIKQFVQKNNHYSTMDAREEYQTRGVIPEKELLYHLKKRPLKRFFKFYVRKFGFLDGIYGLIFSVLYSWLHFVNWAKYWELAQNTRSEKTGGVPAVR